MREVLYRPAVPPSFFAALRLALRALTREPWLVAVGLVVALARRAAVWPAWIVATVLVGRAALHELARDPLDPAAPARAVVALVAAPRFLALVGGLWLAGVALAAALRVAYLAGALPSLGGAMARAPGPRFAAGVAFGFPRVVATAALGLALEVSGALFGGALALGAVAVTVRVAGRGASPLLAMAVAAALTLAVAVPLALSTVADAAVSRAAVRGDAPGRALAAGGARFLSRPGTFLVAALAFAVAGWFVPGAVGAAAGLLTGFVQGAAPLVVLGPQLMVAVAAALVAAGVDLAWLGTITALACAEDAVR